MSSPEATATVATAGREGGTKTVRHGFKFFITLHIFNLKGHPLFYDMSYFFIFYLIFGYIARGLSPVVASRLLFVSVLGLLIVVVSLVTA